MSGSPRTNGASARRYRVLKSASKNVSYFGPQTWRAASWSYKVLSALLALIFVATAFAGINYNATTSGVTSGAAEQFLGYNKEAAKWEGANLGKAYIEGNWVAYQLGIRDSSQIWGLTDFTIGFNFFQASSGAVYVDGFDTSATNGFQYTSKGDFLPNGRDVPTGSPSL